ncbi:MAG: hypothetical protein ACLRWQ_07855 [Flavonifractor plautii]
MLDAWERLRPAPDTRVEWEIEDYGEFPELFPALASGEDFPALNALAEKLAGLSGQERTAFEGLVRLQDGRPAGTRAPSLPWPSRPGTAPCGPRGGG